MIDGRNINIIRNLVRKIRAEMGANTEAVADLNELIGASPLPTGKTVTSAIGNTPLVEGKTVTSELADHETRIGVLENAPAPTGGGVKYIRSTYQFTSGEATLSNSSIPAGYTVISVKPAYDSSDCVMVLGEDKRNGTFPIYAYNPSTMQPFGTINIDTILFIAQVEQYQA